MLGEQLPMVVDASALVLAGIVGHGVTLDSVFLLPGSDHLVKLHHHLVEFVAQCYFIRVGRGHSELK